MNLTRLKWQLIAGLLIAVVATSAMRVYWFARPARDSNGRTVLRIGHYMLSPTTKEALAAVIADYERRRPDVQVIAMPIPASIYLTFLNANLNADTAPDLLQIGHQFTGFEELRTRFFYPITDLVEQPNPYNAGTASEHVWWPNTFIDNLKNLESYSSAEHQYYGVPLALQTLRVFFNRTMLREITGSDEPPSDYTAFIALCEQVEAFAKKTGRSFSPVAGSKLSGLYLMSVLFSSVNQRLNYEIDANHSLAVHWWDYSKAYLQGKWSFTSPSIRAGFDIMRETGHYMRPGFLELSQSDASFQFLEQQALMVIDTTSASVVLRDLAPFPVDIANIPMVKPNDPRYGRYVLGRSRRAINQPPWPSASCSAQLTSRWH